MTFLVQFFTGVVVNVLAGTLLFLSLGITVFSTTMIIYRIYHVSKGNRSSKYSFTVEVLAESGAMYAVTVLVFCVLLVVHDNTFHPARGDTLFWVGVITPVAVSYLCMNDLNLVDH